jgi:hypothetical protein
VSVVLRWRSRRPASPDPTDVAVVAKELLRLDPWAFWSVELVDDAASFAVLGRTGAFVVAACPLEGYLVAEGRDLVVDGARVEGWRALQSSAKALSGRLAAVGATGVTVTPVLVLTRAIAGAPREHRGVRVLRPEDVVREFLERDNVLDPSTAQRLATSLGRVLRGPGSPQAPEPEG